METQTQDNHKLIDVQLYAETKAKEMFEESYGHLTFRALYEADEGASWKLKAAYQQKLDRQIEEIKKEILKFAVVWESLDT